MQHSAAIEFPNDLEIVITREFDAPIGLAGCWPQSRINA